MYMITRWLKFALYLQHQHQAKTTPGMSRVLPEKTALTEDYLNIHMITRRLKVVIYIQHQHQVKPTPRMRRLLPEKTDQTEDN